MKLGSGGRSSGAGGLDLPLTHTQVQSSRSFCGLPVEFFVERRELDCYN